MIVVRYRYLKCNSSCTIWNLSSIAVLWIRIRRICMYLNLLIRFSHYLYGSGFFHQQEKKSLENLDFYYIVIFLPFSLNTDVNALSKSKKTKFFFTKYLLVVGILSTSDEKSKIRIRESVVRSRGSGSVLIYHGFTTLLS